MSSSREAFEVGLSRREGELVRTLLPTEETLAEDAGFSTVGVRATIDFFGGDSAAIRAAQLGKRSFFNLARPRIRAA